MKVISRIIKVIWVGIRVFSFFVVAICAFFAYLLLAIGAAIGIGVGKTIVHEGKTLIKRVSSLFNNPRVEKEKEFYFKKKKQANSCTR